MADKVYGPADYKINPAKNPPTQIGGFEVGDLVTVAGEAGWCVVSTTVLGQEHGVTVINQSTGAIEKVVGADKLGDASAIAKA